MIQNSNQFLVDHPELKPNENSDTPASDDEFIADELEEFEGFAGVDTTNLTMEELDQLLERIKREYPQS